jgi:AcrR family transcriptional regulator
MSRATARFQDKREAILDEAARLFNEHGVKGGMLSDVARQVGLATNSLTYYYRKKEDLACACLLRSMDALVSVADAALAETRLERRVGVFLERYVGLLAAIAEHRHPQLIVFSDVLSLGEPHHATVAAAYNQMFRRVRQLLDAPDAPTLSPAARNARAHLLLSTTSWARAWLVRYESDDFARVAERLCDLLIHGLGATDRRSDPQLGAALVDAPLAQALRAAGDGDDPSDSGATRAAYLRAATRLVNEHGYHGASVDRIAAELKLTKGSFYHHHETKEDLIAACFDRTFAVTRAAQTAALQAQGTGLDRLAAACRALLAFQLSEQGPLLRITAWTGLPDAIRRDTRRTMGRLGERFASLVLDGMADGSVRIVDPSITAQVANGMVNAVAEIERWVRGIDAGNAFELYAMPLFTGLRAPPLGEGGPPAGPAALPAATRSAIPAVKRPRRKARAA